MKLKEAMDVYLPLIEGELRACLTPPTLYGSAPRFFGMLHYAMGWTDEQFRAVSHKGGKRLRPVFTLLTCQAAGGGAQTALPAAAAVELIHNFSLIHDDIQDRSPTRHGRPTVWALWSEAQAINAGDAMFALAHLALHRLAQRGLTADRVVGALRILDETNLALCYGQHLDLDFENRLDVGPADYLTMIGGKTAALLGCAGQLGAMVASPDPTLAGRYRQVGNGLGLAFQAQDDLLGIWGETELTGKPVGEDIRRRKKSLPVVNVLGRQSDPGAERLRALYSQEMLTEEDVAEAIGILEESGARSYVESLARQYQERALAELEAAKPEPEAGEALRDMAHFFISRTS